MPAGPHNAVASPHVRNGGPQPALTLTPEPASSKQNLTSWWRQFSKRPAKKDDEKEPVPTGIFGVPLIQSIPYANVAISLFNEHGESYIYGYVPIVVAKCGVFLKEKATDIEGIFRLAGSEKRIKELKSAFDTPPRYGKGLDWTGYTVHDAANILRRYFNHLPEPIIPLQHYDPFRQPLRGHQAEAVGPIEGQAPSVGGFDPDAAVSIYQHHIKGLPSLNRQLLLYILDLLAVFAAKSDINKMTTSNLAAIFQPGILSHPQHDMSPQDYRLSQDVLIFLIDNQDHFLIGMEGTAVDEGTVKHIESGPPTPQARTPTASARNNTGLGRSASTSSSAGAASLRKTGGVRRNVSTSSKRSRQSGAVPSPVTPSTPAIGVQRSNTVPSKRSPAIGGPLFSSGKQSGPTTPATEEVKNPLSSPPLADATVSVANAKQESEQSVPLADPTRPAPSVAGQAQQAHGAQEPEQIMRRAQTMPPQRIDLPKSFHPRELPPSKLQTVNPAVDQTPSTIDIPSPRVIPPSGPVTPNATSTEAPHPLVVPHASPPSSRSPHHSPRHEKSEFQEGPIDSDPPIEHPAVRSFTQILAMAGSPPVTEGKDGRKKLQKKRLPNSTNPSAHSSTHSLTAGDNGMGVVQSAAGFSSPLQPPQPPFAQGQGDTPSSRSSGTTLKPSMSPSTSFRSHSTATEQSEDAVEEHHREEKRSFWKSHRRDESRVTPTASQADLHGSMPGGDKSMSSIASSSAWTGGGRRSLQNDGPPNLEATTSYGSPPDHDRHDKKGAFEWFHKLRHDHKERSDKRERAKSPPGSSHNPPIPQNLMQSPERAPGRGRSMDVPRPVGAPQTQQGMASDVRPGVPTQQLPPQPQPQPRPQPAQVPIPSDANSSVVPQESSSYPSPASNSQLPSALTEAKSIAQQPISGRQTQDTASLAQPALKKTPAEREVNPAVTEDANTASAPQTAQPQITPSQPHHAASDSTATVTPDENGSVLGAPISAPPEQERPSDAPTNVTS